MQPLPFRLFLQAFHLLPKPQKRSCLHRDEHVITPGQGSGEHLTRVYGHRLEVDREASDLATLAALGGEQRWASAEELNGLQEAEQRWVGMWQGECDEDGLPVRRTFGYRGDAGKHFSHNGPGNPLMDDGSGNPSGLHIIGNTGEDGLPEQGPAKAPAPSQGASLLPPL